MTTYGITTPLTARSPVADMSRWGGGKAAGLHRLAATGVPVPRWAVVGTDVLHLFVRGHGLDERIERVLSEVTPDRVEGVAARLADLIGSATMDDDVRSAVLATYEAAGGGTVAVRSSAVEEDAAEFSFAGQFATFLNVSGERDVLENVRACWVSAFAPRALRYRLEHELDVSGVSMAVIVQEFVEADRSGVLFTANPTSGRRDELVVSAVYGLGEGLVSGAVDADTVILDRTGLRPPDWTIGEKAVRFDGGGAGTGVLSTSVPDGLAAAPCVTTAELAELAELGGRIEAAAGCPQDVEWAIGADGLVVLQSRPITGLPDRPPRTAADRILIWDNSNIVENFGGISSPLTFSFARHVYHRAHQEYCRVLRVPERQLREMDDWQRNRLGYFHGRVYYNLLTWYRMQHLLPFAGMKRRIMELSMGVAEPIDDTIAGGLRPCTFGTRREELVVRGRAAVVFGWQLLRAERYVERFLDEFSTVSDRFEALDYESMAGDEIYRCYRELDRELLPRWAPMVGLEAIILTGFGLLLGLTRRWMPQAPEWLYWKVAAVGGEVESAQPARDLADIAAVAAADPDLARLLADGDPATLPRTLRDHGQLGFLARVGDYIDRFGYRSVNELKLEEPDLREDPAVFYDMLRGAISAAKPAGATDESGDEVDRYLDEHLTPGRRRAYELLRRRVQASLRARESVRFCRTRAFGLARRMFRAIGRDLARLGALDSERDVFLLTLEEIRDCFEGTSGPGRLTETVAERRREQAANARLTAPARFVTSGPVYWDRAADEMWRGEGAEATDLAVAGTVLHGTPCGPGTAEGVAKVVTEPRGVNGEVVVTYRTDPGWIGVLPSAAALLIERGSPLTHVAIVARELGVPTVVQIKNLTSRVRSGSRLRVDGRTGEVRVLSDGAGPGPTDHGASTS